MFKWCGDLITVCPVSGGHSGQVELCLSGVVI